MLVATVFFVTSCNDKSSTNGTNGTSSAQELTVIGWNVESGGAQTPSIVAWIEEIDDCDIWGFSEVLDRN